MNSKILINCEFGLEKERERKIETIKTEYIVFKLNIIIPRYKNGIFNNIKIIKIYRVSPFLHLYV